MTSFVINHKIYFRVNFTDVDATTGQLQAFERDGNDRIWKGVSLKKTYFACKYSYDLK